MGRMWRILMNNHVLKFFDSENKICLNVLRILFNASDFLVSTQNNSLLIKNFGLNWWKSDYTLM